MTDKEKLDCIGDELKKFNLDNILDLADLVFFVFKVYEILKE